jgi:hypothetical protein
MLTRLNVTALKDDARILGLILAKGAKLELDIVDGQLDAVQKAIDSGDVEVEGMARKSAPMPEAKAEPKAEPKKEKK